MVRGLLVCLAVVSVASAQDGQNNTRIFGALGNLAGNLAGGALGAIGGALGGAQQGFRPPHQQGFPGQAGGFGQGGGFPGQAGGFGQGGGFPGQAGGFGQVGGFPGQAGGFGQVGGFPGAGGFGQVGGFPGGVGQGVGGSGGSRSCRRWCRTPQGQAYCCEGADEPLTAAIAKGGQCPPVRPQCPPTRFHNPPARCSSDGACAGHDKCCFDTCLQHHTCKPPIGLGK